MYLAKHSLNVISACQKHCHGVLGMIMVMTLIIAKYLISMYNNFSLNIYYVKQGNYSREFCKDKMKTILLDGSAAKLRAGILGFRPLLCQHDVCYLEGVIHCYVSHLNYL